MANSRFITVPIDTDPRDLIQRAFNYIQAKIPGWQPSEGQLDTWMIEAFGNEAADIATLASQVPKSIFRYMGANLVGIPPIDASLATVNTTWYFTDSLGHNITRGTQVGIRDSSGVLHPFIVLIEVDVAGGSSSTTSGAVLCVAAEAGAASSGLGSVGGTVELIDTLSWVDHITMTAASSGGVDAETDDDYLNRLTLELQTMSPRPILPRDFAILARNIAGVQRAAVLDEYNPADNTYGNERMVTVVSVDAAGTGVSSTIKTNLATYLEAMREINFIVNTMDPTSGQIDVTCHVSILTGYVASDVISRVASAITNYLNPAIWGIDDNDNPNNPKTWNNITHVYYLELASLIDNVPGVDRVVLLQIGAHGGSLSAADYTMSGVVPLPSPGTINITVV